MSFAEARLADHIYNFDEQEREALRKRGDEAIVALEVAYKSANVSTGLAQVEREEQ